MKITAQEEYGLRCALQLARAGTGGSLTLPEIASREGLTVPHAGKLLAMLRQGGVVRSVRGRTGGYSIARPADSITAAEVLRALGTRPWPRRTLRPTPGHPLGMRSLSGLLGALALGLARLHRRPPARRGNPGHDLRARPRSRGRPRPVRGVRGAAVLAVLTEWDEFRWLDFDRVLATLAHPAVLDARNLLDPVALRRRGFIYEGVGR